MSKEKLQAVLEALVDCKRIAEFEQKDGDRKDRFEMHATPSGILILHTQHRGGELRLWNVYGELGSDNKMETVLADVQRMVNPPKQWSRTEGEHEHRVWIELDDFRKVKDPAERERLRNEAAERATNMLQRLNGPGAEPNGPRCFWWSDRDARYCYGGPMGYTVLSDSGQWFNLNYYGRGAEFA